MNSMTGYAFRERQEEDYSLSVELRGYNSRFLEINFFLPPYFSSLERRIRELITPVCVRGRVDVTVRYRDQNSPFKVTVNHEAVTAYRDAFNSLAEILGAGEKPDIKTLIDREGVLELEWLRDEDRYWRRIEGPLTTALDLFTAERSREGLHTREHILSQIGVIEASLQQVALHADELESLIKENLRSRFFELLGDAVDENRVLAETAVLLMKHTIAEEISRLQSHLSEFRAEAEKNPHPGKKLDFLSQEMNREINTIGSKTPHIEVSRAVVEMKNALENVREELRNVE
ncbi:MAG: YicC family protein [Treponema sp.]|jgi:uncharacterized protein (TIGR00255 family)|nr:YicC family protein [Treponema sp.]